MKKCPKCEKSLTHVKVAVIQLITPTRPSNRPGAAYVCPECETILGVGMDELALAEETVDEITQKISAALDVVKTLVRESEKKQAKDSGNGV